MINWLASSGWFFIICLFVFVFNSVGRLHILVRGSLEVSTYHCTVSECIVQWGATGQPIAVKSPAEDNEQWSVSANEKSGLHNVHIGSGKMRMTTVSVPVEVRLVTFLSVLSSLGITTKTVSPATCWREAGGWGTRPRRGSVLTWCPLQERRPSLLTLQTLHLNGNAVNI